MRSTFHCSVQRMSHMVPYSFRCHIRDWPLSMAHKVYPVTCHRVSFETLCVSDHCHESHGYE